MSYLTPAQYSWLYFMVYGPYVMALVPLVVALVILRLMGNDIRRYAKYRRTMQIISLLLLVPLPAVYFVTILDLPTLVSAAVVIWVLIKIWNDARAKQLTEQWQRIAIAMVVAHIFLVALPSSYALMRSQQAKNDYVAERVAKIGALGLDYYLPSSKDYSAYWAMLGADSLVISDPQLRHGELGFKKVSINDTLKCVDGGNVLAVYHESSPTLGNCMSHGTVAGFDVWSYGEVGSSTQPSAFLGRYYTLRVGSTAIVYYGDGLDGQSLTPQAKSYMYSLKPTTSESLAKLRY